MTYLAEAFRSCKRGGKPWYEKWSDDAGNVWSSVKLPHIVIKDLNRAVKRDPSSCLPSGWSLQIDPASGQPYFVLLHPTSNYIVLQQWHHPSINGVAVGFHSRNPKSAMAHAANAACDMLASVGRLSSERAGGRSSKKNRPAGRHPASSHELKRLASEQNEWYIYDRGNGKKGLHGNASIKGLRSTLSTCFSSYRWGKPSARMSFVRRGAMHVCRIILPDEVLDELPELAETAKDQRWVMGDGPSRLLAESLALLRTCRALARLGLLVENGVGTGGHESAQGTTINPFFVPFPTEHTKGYKTPCTSSHSVLPAPTVSLRDSTLSRLSLAVAKFRCWMPTSKSNENCGWSTRMPPCLPGIVTGGAEVVEKASEEASEEVSKEASAVDVAKEAKVVEVEEEDTVVVEV